MAYNVAANMQPVNFIGNMLDARQQEIGNSLAQREMGVREQNALMQRQQFDAQNQQRQAAQKEQEQAAIREWVINGAKHLASAKSEQEFAMLADRYASDPRTQQLGITRDQITPDGVSQILMAVGGAPVQQQAPEQFTMTPGSVRYERAPDGGVRQVASVPALPRAGISMTTPDGSVIQVGGDPNARVGAVSLGKPTQSKLEQAFSDAQANAMALSQQMAKWRPEFSTYSGQVRAAAGNVADKMGASIPQEQKQALLDYNAWKSDTSGLLSAYLNQLSGAAISPAEEKRLRAAFPNDEDGPSQYQAKASATLKRFALVQARAAYLLSHPDINLDSVSIEGMESVILKEANVLAKAMQARGVPPADAKAQAVAQTKARYGIGQ